MDNGIQSLCHETTGPWRIVRYRSVSSPVRISGLHSWSANSRWVIFSSRRFDGRYTRSYISYVDEQGTFHKPFMLPQRNPDSNERLYCSYNIPELVTGNIDVSPRSGPA